jgi:hypothetical protein
MAAKTFALISLSVLVASGARAQSAGPLPDLTGVYRCVRNCAGTAPARIFQHGWELHLTNEAGEAAVAWIDRAGHMNSQTWNAVYSPDGFTIQFNSGSVWVLLQPLSGAPFKQW